MLPSSPIGRIGTGDHWSLIRVPFFCRYAFSHNTMENLTIHYSLIEFGTFLLIIYLIQNVAFVPIWTHWYDHWSLIRVPFFCKYAFSHITMKNKINQHGIWNIFSYYIFDPKCCLCPHFDALVQEISDHLSELISTLNVHFPTTQWKI